MYESKLKSKSHMFAERERRTSVMEQKVNESTILKIQNKLFIFKHM